MQYPVHKNAVALIKSLKIAEHFGKRHDHIIRDIEKIIEQTADLPEALRFEPPAPACAWMPGVCI